MRPDGTFVPGTGTLSRFQPSGGRGVRVDTAGYPGYTVSLRYDPLLAKVITDGGTLEEAARRALWALAEFDIAGVPTNVGLLQALLRAILQGPGLGVFEVGWVDAHAAELVAASPIAAVPAAADPVAPVSLAVAVPPGHAAVRAPLAGTVVSVTAAPGNLVAPGDELLVIEAMKMEHEVRAKTAGLVHEVPVTAGATVQAGAVLVVLEESADDVTEPGRPGDIPLDHVRPDLAEVRERHRIGLDEGRPEVTERRHASGRRTARENIANLVDEGSFTEYGALTIAAQRRRRSLDDLIVRTPADGLVAGTARIGGWPVAVMSYDPDEVGPMSIQVPNGVVDLLVEDEAAAVAAARRYLSYVGGARAVPRDAPHGDQRVLRHLVPENRVRGYDVRPVIEALCDTGSVLELRAGFGIGVRTALARIGGHAVGLLASNPLQLGGAIDGDAADKATAFLGLCEAHRLPVVSLVDTPGFMVGPTAERTAIVRRFGALFVAGARLTVPVCAVVLRKAYGLGAMAMTAGDLRRPAITVAWPTGEFGGMGLEGAVRLGYRSELDALEDPDARRARYEELVAEQYTRGKALSTAAAFEIDDVIDPADTRAVLTGVLARAAAGG